MHRETFVKRFHDATRAAVGLARKFIEEALPDEVLFRVRLNSSYDRNPLHPDMVVYHGDGSFERARELHECTAEDVVAALFREGKVPQWVDVSVIGCAASSTLVQLACCGRFTASDELLYHQKEGRPPFHVVGPALPARYVVGKRFSIYHRCECWGSAEIERLQKRVNDVWSLKLIGDAADVRTLKELPEFPRMEILELKGGSVSGEGLRELHRHRSLRVLRICLGRTGELTAEDFPNLPHLTTLDIENLARTRLSVDRVVDKYPDLRSVTLEGAAEMTLEGTFPDALHWLTITAPRVSENVTLPRRVVHLGLHLAGALENEVERLLQPIESLRYLSLRNTPVGDVLLEKISARWHLEYLDVVGTSVTEKGVRSVAAAHPKLRMHPNLAIADVLQRP